MTSKDKRIAVIGAGSSGLTAIKACKEENVDVVCFERSGDPGGLWRYHDEDIDGVASVMKTTIINTSKEIGAYSDFPPPKEFPNYMHNRYMYKYFLMYAEHFDLLRHIQYHTEVISVERADDYDDTGRWLVVTKNCNTGDINEQQFDGVMVCIGHHVYPKMPTFSGQESFKGEIMHTHSLKNCERFSGKNVVVVGIGNSGVDAAVDSTFTAKQVYLSTRRGSWIMSRVGKNGLPSDYVFAQRINFLLGSLLPFEFICNSLEKDLNENFDHALYNIQPKHRVLNAHPTLNDAIPNCIISGKVKMKDDISRFVENGILFKGDEHATEVDVVIFATGYKMKFPFLKENISTEDNKVNLYKYAIPPTLAHKTLAIIGNIQPLGPIFPIAEMQARWFMQVFNKKIKLPSRMEMEKEIIKKNDENAKRYVDSTRHTVQVDFVPFLDEMAEQMGAKPNLLKWSITDPKLFYACMFYPAFPYQYRLQGPHKWEGARNAIFNYEERLKFPFNTGGSYCRDLQKKTSEIGIFQITYKVLAYIGVMILLIFRMIY